MSNFKEPFLEFLRNLTPQILLLSIALVLSAKLDFDHFDITNTWGSLLFFLVIGAFFAATIANVLVFMEKTIKSTRVVDSKVQELCAKNINWVQYLFGSLKILWGFKKIVLIELICAVLVIEAGVTAVFIGVRPAASTLYNATHSSNKQNACKNSNTEKIARAL